MTIRDDARQEAERRWPSNHLVDDPFGETGEAWSDPYGYHEEAQRAFIDGAIWGSEKADREPSDAEVLDSARAVLSEMQKDLDFDPEYDYWEDAMRYAQAALLGAQEVRDAD